MLIARAPVRISFFGGGTDLPAYYERHGGAVLSATIDRYVYVVLNVSERKALQVTSSDYRTFYRHQPGQPLMWEGDLDLPRAVLHYFGVETGVSLFLASEVPPGTGLGSSGSVMVALIKAMSVACDRRLDAKQVAELACQLEMGRLGRPIGVQDQYAAAFGGLNWMTFAASGIGVEPVSVTRAAHSRLESNLLLMFTGLTRDSANILARQGEASRRGTAQVVDALRATRELASRGRELLVRGEMDAFGRLLDEAWQQKKRFDSGISNEAIDRWYALARSKGALGGKIAGAGGGGFLMLYCEDGAADRVAKALGDAGLRRMDYCLEADGARVLFNAGLRLPSAKTVNRPAGVNGITGGMI